MSFHAFVDATFSDRQWGHTTLYRGAPPRHPLPQPGRHRGPFLALLLGPAHLPSSCAPTLPRPMSRPIPLAPQDHTAVHPSSWTSPDWTVLKPRCLPGRAVGRRPLGNPKSWSNIADFAGPERIRTATALEAPRLDARRTQCRTTTDPWARVLPSAPPWAPLDKKKAPRPNDLT